MTNEEKAKEICCSDCVFVNKGLKWCTPCTGAKVGIPKMVEMAKWKDQQPISEQEGWHEEEPTEDGWYLVNTPDFPKNCCFIVAEWDNDSKHFYSEASDEPIDYEKWKLIEKKRNE